MKISADRKQLLGALSVCTQIARGGTYSVLENVRLSTWAQEIGGEPFFGLTVEATNLSETLRFHFPGEGMTLVSRGDPILVNAARLRAYLAAEEADRVSMEVKEGKSLHLKGKRSLSLRLPGDTFPDLPTPPAGEPTAILDQEALFSALGRALPFRGEGKHASPASVLLRSAEGRLRAYATNGHRLYRETSICDCPEAFEAKVSPGLAKLLLACADEGQEVAVHLGTAHDAWVLPGVEIFSLRDEEQHYPYDQTLDRVEGEEHDLSPETSAELLKAVEAALVIGEEAIPGVARQGGTLDLTYDGKAGALIVSLVSAYGSAREEIELPARDGGSSWRFSTYKGRDLVQALEVLEGPVRLTKAPNGQGLKLESLDEEGFPGEKTVYLTEVKR